MRVEHWIKSLKLVATVVYMWLSFSEITASRLIVYWGQNGAASEKELNEYCNAQSPFDSIIVGYLNDFFSSTETDNFPSLNLANHCSSSTLLNGFNSLFYCQSVEEAIQLCQKNNKSVQIALGGSYGGYSIGNATQGEVFAKRIWALFFGGNGPRPFGSAVLDGVNLDIVKEPYTGYPEFVKSMHELMVSNKSKKYMITATSRCTDLSPVKNLGETLKLYGDFFDEIYVNYYQDQCTSKGEFFNQNIAEWFAFTNQFSRKPLVYLNLLAAPIDSLKDYYQDSDGVEGIVKKVKVHANFGGIVLYDAGYDESTVFNNKKYSDAVKMILLSNFVILTTASTYRNLSSTTLNQPNTEISSTASTSKSISLQTEGTTKKKPQSNFTEELISLSKIHDCLDALCVKDLAKNLSSIVLNSSLISVPKDVVNIRNVIKTVVSGIDFLPSSQLLSVVHETMNSVNYVISADFKILKQAEQLSGAPTGLIKILEQLGQTISKSVIKNRNGSFEVIKDQVVLKVKHVQKDNLYIQAFEEEDQNMKVVIEQGDRRKNMFVKKEGYSSSVEIPAVAFNDVDKVVFVLAYRTASLFINNDTQLSNSQTHSVIRSILSVTVANTTIKQLTSPIKLSFQKDDTNVMQSSATCKYWDDKGSWSTEGCFKIEESCETIKCHCNHLTNFALVFDTSQTKSNPIYLQIVTWAGSGVSLLALFLTIFTILLFRSIRKQYIQQLILNICISLVTLIIVFNTGAERKCKRELSCQAVALIIQFFTLSTFSWMSFVGLKLYHDFIQMFRIQKHITLWKVHIFGWGFPLMVVATTLGVGKRSLVTDKYCLIHGKAFYFGVLLPCALVLAGNFVVLLVTLVRITNSASFVGCSTTKRQSAHETLNSIKIALAFGTLLGITWVFAMLAIGPLTSTFQWLFCIFNSLQGFFIFIFYSMRNMRAWKQLLVCHPPSEHQSISTNRRKKSSSTEV